MQKFPLDLSSFDYWSDANKAATAFKNDIQVIHGTTWQERFLIYFLPKYHQLSMESRLKSIFYMKHLGVNQRIEALIHLIDHDTNHLDESCLLELEEYVTQKKCIPYFSS